MTQIMKKICLVLLFGCLLSACGENNTPSEAQSNHSPTDENGEVNSKKPDENTPEEVKEDNTASDPDHKKKPKDNPIDEKLRAAEEFLTQMKREVKDWAERNYSDGSAERLAFFVDSNKRLIESVQKLASLECGEGVDVIREIRAELLLRKNYDTTVRIDRLGNRVIEILNDRLRDCPGEAQ